VQPEEHREKMIETIAATPAAKPNQLIQRGRIA
jgi:hypothetical protein